MASGCRIVASNTAPVREVITGGEGSLTDFFRPLQISEDVLAALEFSQSCREMRRTAYKSAQEYSRSFGLAGYLQEIHKSTNGDLGNALAGQSVHGVPLTNFLLMDT